MTEEQQSTPELVTGLRRRIATLVGLAQAKTGDPDRAFRVARLWQWVATGIMVAILVADILRQAWARLPSDMLYVSWSVLLMYGIYLLQHVTNAVVAKHVASTSASNEEAKFYAAQRSVTEFMRSQMVSTAGAVDMPQRPKRPN